MVCSSERFVCVYLIFIYLQGWRSNVKARNFVLVLRDYFRHKEVTKDNKYVLDNDNWALQYIDLGQTQSIKEAFDDDASGFITIQEVNRLTELRPRDWRQV
jgi:hypothetical protein